MNLTFPKIVEDASVPVDTLIILNPRYRMAPSKDDRMVLEEVLDIEATAKASLVVKNIGTGKENT